MRRETSSVQEQEWSPRSSPVEIVQPDATEHHVVLGRQRDLQPIEAGQLGREPEVLELLVDRERHL
jgi:hypothetical protein